MAMVMYGSEVKEILDKTEVTAPGVSKSDVPYQVAVNAYSGTSFSPEARAYRQQIEYVQHMNAVWDDLSKQAKTPEQKELLKSEFQDYRRQYLSHQLEYLHSHSRIVSSFIAGPSNFPGRQMRKRNDATDKKVSEWMEWDSRAQKAIKKKLNPTMYAISSDRSDATELLKKKLEGLEKSHAIMVESNKIIRGKGDQDEKVKKITELGISEATARKMFEKDFAGNIGFPGWELSNSSANIKRIKERIESLEKSRSQSSSSIEFNGGTLTDSVEDNRIQLQFDGKPSQEIINKLKSHGFHWTPSLGVWQRMRSPAATYYAEEVAGVKLPKATAKPAEVEETAVAMPKVEDEEEEEKPTQTETRNEEGKLLARFVERKMSPTTGLDTDYIREWRLVHKPDNAPAEWMGNEWGIKRSLTVGGEERYNELLETGSSPESTAKTMPWESDFEKAEKFGVLKTHYDKVMAERKAKEEAKLKAEQEETEKSNGFESEFSPLRSMKGIKETDIQIATFPDYKNKVMVKVKGFDVGRGLGVAIAGEGKYKTYTVTHLNSGLGFGSGITNKNDAIALARAEGMLTDWSKYPTDKDVPKNIMDDAAALVRASVNRKLDKNLEKYTAPTNPTPEPVKAAPAMVEHSQVAHKEQPNLVNGIGIHSDYGTWANYLKTSELREEYNGVKHYISSNSHYIVMPNGDVKTFYGYHGNNAFYQLSGKETPYQEEQRLAREFHNKEREKAKVKSTPLMLSAPDPRPARSEAIDRSVTAKTVTGDYNEWAKRRNRVDLNGVDTKNGIVTVRTVPDKEITPKVKPQFRINRRVSGAGRGVDLGADIVKDRRGRHLRL